MALVLLAIVGVAAAYLLKAGDKTDKEIDARATDPRIAEEISLAEQRVGEGRLAGPGGDEAIDHFLAAKRLDPTNPSAVKGLRMLADKFEELGDSAFEKANYEEAAAHFRAALRAAPERQKLKNMLGECESRERERAGALDASPE